MYQLVPLCGLMQDNRSSSEPLWFEWEVAARPHVHANVWSTWAKHKLCEELYSQGVPVFSYTTATWVIQHYEFSNKNRADRKRSQSNQAVCIQQLLVKNNSGFANAIFPPQHYQLFVSFLTSTKSPKAAWSGTRKTKW